MLVASAAFVAACCLLLAAASKLLMSSSSSFAREDKCEIRLNAFAKRAAVCTQTQFMIGQTICFASAIASSSA